jgi:hypothetical protein
MYYTGGGSYYTGQSGDLEQAQVPAGMGVLPILPIVGAAAALIPSVAGLFAKNKGPKGPSPKQIMEMQRQQQELEKKKFNERFLMIGGGALILVGIAGWLYLRGKK